MFDNSIHPTSSKQLAFVPHFLKSQNPNNAQVSPGVEELEWTLLTTNFLAKQMISRAKHKHEDVLNFEC